MCSFSQKNVGAAIWKCPEMRIPLNHSLLIRCSMKKNHQLLESPPGPWKPPDVAAGVAAPLEAFPLGDCGLQPAGDAGDGPAQGGAAGGGSRNGFVMISMYHSI